jgi:Domain of unknown function (DUF1735)
MNKKIINICLALLAITLGSCLDDDKAILDPSNSQNIIEFADPSVPSSPAGAIFPAYSTSFVLSPQVELIQEVNFAGPNDNNQDVTLTLAVDPSALALYNEHMQYGLYGKPGLNGTVFDLMPTENYSIPSLTVTIPKGQRKATVSITVFPDKFDFSKNFAIPLRIVSSSTGIISQNFGVAILGVGVRNNYDGIYEIVGGSITRNSAAGPDLALGGPYDPELTLDLVTLGSNTVAIEPVWKDGSAVGGITGTQLAINGTTNAVTVTSSGNSSLKNTPASVNTYDPATREFTLNFDWGAAPNTRIISGLKLRYVSPRP